VELPLCENILYFDYRSELSPEAEGDNIGKGNVVLVGMFVALFWNLVSFPPLDDSPDFYLIILCEETIELSFSNSARSP